MNFRTELAKQAVKFQDLVAIRKEIPSNQHEHTNPSPDTGRSSPLGATVRAGGVNFSLFSRSATGVELLFFDREDDSRPARVLRLDPALNRTSHYWHIFVPGVQPGQIYGYRAQGPYDPADGHPQTLLCDTMNRQPLTREHGAPLRLYLAVKYGYKSLKRLGLIRFQNERPPDYWAARGYDWYAGL